MFVYMIWLLPCGRYTKTLVTRFKSYSRGLDSNIVLLLFTLPYNTSVFSADRNINYNMSGFLLCLKMADC